MKKILIMSMTKTKSDPRVMRQIQAFKKECEIYVVGEGGLDDETIKYFEVLDRRNIGHELLRLFRFHSLYNSFRYKKNFDIDEIINTKPDIIIANDIETLPLAFKISLAHGSKLIFDAHEYYPGHFSNGLLWRLLVQPYNKKLCAQYIPKVNGFITVSEGIADLYKSDYGVEQPIVITNAPVYHDLKPTTVDPNHIKMIHHGVANPSRRLEIMIEAVKLLDDRFTLDLMIVGRNSKYLKFLKKAAGEDDRIKFIDPVSMVEISYFINKYDIGLYLLPPENINQVFALPNKFFEFIQARLMLAIGPSSEMANIINKFNCGRISNDFTSESFALILKDLQAATIEKYKYNSGRAAIELNAEKNVTKLKEIVFNQLEK